MDPGRLLLHDDPPPWVLDELRVMATGWCSTTARRVRHFRVFTEAFANTPFNMEVRNAPVTRAFTRILQRIASCLVDRELKYTPRAQK